jgi:hypothetical protein
MGNTDRVTYTFILIYTIVSHYVLVWCNFTIAKGLVKYQEMARSMEFKQQLNIDKTNVMKRTWSSYKRYYTSNYTLQTGFKCNTLLL